MSAKPAQWVQVLQSVVMVIIGFIEILLVFRFVFQLFGASSRAEIVNWVFDNSAAFLGPFSGAFSSLSFGTFEIEFNTLLAIFAYAVIGYLIKEALGMMR